MVLVLFRDMKRASFSCSSSASAAISNSIIRHSPQLRDPKRKKSDNSNQKLKEPPQNPPKPSQKLISPVDSSRYLLKSSRLQFDESARSFIDIIPEPRTACLPVPVTVPVPVPVPSSDLVPVESSCTDVQSEKENKPVMLRSCSSRTQDQTVELRVSLHCKGCAGKVKKHISKMEGVTSFNIDLDSKKVTVIGDVTPLGVLSSVSKVKNAQFWNSSPARASVSF
ncbi:Heavy metal-associated isoprenylated plant protein 36 [Rhynchospora pubera]|uniref:Heavy metal-associated isoprenylated plant protein 36 n=1 Tax=Rhynchospora pubera TaxID=906938 RepID=A0AAV8ERC9_9POAL|nr:Heavy metal-associated isoprenylated plant protein 36 [Rhynchospora pubera]